MMNDRRMRNLALMVLPLVLVGWLMSSRAPQPEPISYSQFISQVQAGDVAGVTIVGERTALVEYYARDSQPGQVTLPPQAPDLPALLAEAGVEQRYVVQGTNWLATLLPILIWGGLLAGLYFMQRRQVPGAALGTRPSKVQIIDPKSIQTTFKDVAGIDEVKDDLIELVGYLKNPDQYREMGARIPKGVLLYGPPGSGKTLVARAVAGEASVPFIHFSGSEFVELFVGMGAARVRELFAQARKVAPAIVFIDEIDAVGRHRGANVGPSNDERDQTLNQLLVEMDGFGNYDGIIVMAATNRADVLDPALLRPGRFDRQLSVDLPDVAGRLAILQVHTRQKRVDPELDLKEVAKRTHGFSGADLANVVNEAALLAVRRAKALIGFAEMEDALERIIGGGPEKKNRVITPAERRRVAVHEAGHAITARHLPGMPAVSKVTIVPRGRAGGYTLMLPEDDRMLLTRTELLHQLVILLGGRAAEQLELGDISTGAQNDLERAVSLARNMVARFGMGSLGPGAVLEASSNPYLQPRHSEELSAAVDREVQSMLAAAEQQARDLLEQHQGELGTLTEALLERETLGARDLDALLGGTATENPAAAPAPATVPS